MLYIFRKLRVSRISNKIYILKRIAFERFQVYLYLRFLFLFCYSMDAVFILGDKLPLIYDAAIAIHSVAKRKSAREKAIHNYSTALRNMWIKAFGQDHVISLKAVKTRVATIMNDYNTKCYKASYNRGKVSKALPLRSLNKMWRQLPVPVKKNTPKQKIKCVTNNDLLDIGKEMQQLTGNEKAYYIDQCSRRIFRLSEEVDEEHEEEKILNSTLEEQEISFQEQEESFSNPPEFVENITPNPKRFAPDSKVVMVDKDIQVNINVCPEIRKGRNTTASIKDTIATVSYRAIISVPKARLATQTVCEKLYGHKYYLEKPKLTTIQEEDEPLSKKPRTIKDYEQYKNVLPSIKAVNTYKHLKAMHQEIEAAEALMNKDENTKVTLHYDTTSRSRIEGEWPCLILNFLNSDSSKCNMFPLRALTFAYEDREQIKSLVLETFQRLATATSNIATSKMLWGKVDAFMTDAVSKNLKVEYLVAEELQSAHVPLHLLCKAHTCEKLDDCNETTLMKMEQRLSVRTTIEKREPRLKSFIRKSKTVVKAAIQALLQLVAKGGDGKSTSLADEFDLVLEEDGVSKSYSLYKEKRFTKLGYTAGAIFECIPQFRKLLERTTKNNLLVRACRLYLESEYILASLKALSNFTYRITMPYLNAVEKGDQNKLITILPQLCSDLKDGNMGTTLQAYHVEWSHICMKNQTPITCLDTHLLKHMCIDAGVGVEMQCAREYWEDTENPRATQIFKLSQEDRENLPTENLEPERYMAKVGNLAGQSAAHSNKFFKAKRMRDDLLFIKESLSSTNSAGFSAAQRKIFKALDSMEMNWSAEQRSKYKNKLKLLCTNNEKRKQFVDILLQKCKEHNGPLTNENELNDLVKSFNNIKLLKSALRIELQYQKAIHVRDAQERPELYKVNSLTEDEMKINLMILFSGDSITDSENALFHTEDEIMELLDPINEIAEEAEVSKPFIITFIRIANYFCILFLMQV